MIGLNTNIGLLKFSNYIISGGSTKEENEISRGEIRMTTIDSFCSFMNIVLFCFVS